MSIRIIKKGSLDAIQDLGRFGYQHLGIPPGGALDPWALQLANGLVGNTPGEAGLELFFPAPTLQFEKDAVIAISGADWQPCLQGIPIDINRTILVKKGAVLTFQQPNSGRVAYVTVRGGFQLEPWLGSCSTQWGVELSGFKGRALLKEDLLPFRSSFEFSTLAPESFLALPWKPALQTSLFNTPIRLLPDSHFHFLDEASQNRLTGASFTILPQSNRMGFLLQGPKLTGNYRELISAAVRRGTIQWLPDEQIILLMADHPTTGGYPRIAQVIAADLPKLAQWPASLPLQFEWISRNDAEQIYREQHFLLTQMQNAAGNRLASYLES
ncbi:MAG: biotin-dependent carboxyltransferase family protein [Bacteroidetes bacterium]|nr:biotin-dependent carboxyltransferase family protein [Bacteroidota bacterium]